MSTADHALYEISVKALIFRGDKLLTLTTPRGSVDFPGGRVDEQELRSSWTEALRREVTEELGTDLGFDVGPTAFVSRREYTKGSVTRNVAAIFFVCQYNKGEVYLSDEHIDHQWLTPHEIMNTNRKFISTDEEKQLRTYLNSL